MKLSLLSLALSTTTILSATREELCTLNKCAEGEIVNADMLHTLDFNKFIYGTSSQKKEIAKLFDDAMRTTGFFYIENHGIDMNLITNVEQGVKDFYSLPRDIKKNYEVELDVTKNEYFVGGYVARGDASQEGKYPDICEGYSIFNGGNRYERAQPTRDLIPDSIKDTFFPYSDAVRNLISIIHEAATMALDLDKNYFEEFMIKDSISNPAFGATYFNYFLPPNTTDIINEEVFGIGPHDDYMGFTVLHTDEVSGLEVNVNGIWFKIEPKKDTLIINAGALMPRWTNGYWTAALHRVRIVEKPRMSIAYFSGPTLDTIIDILPGCKKCIEANQPRLYKPMLARDHITNGQKAHNLNYKKKPLSQLKDEI